MPPQPLSQPPQPQVPPQVDASYGFKTVPTEVPIDQGMKTVVAERPKTEPITPPPSLATVAEAQPPHPDLSTVVAEAPVIVEQKPAVPPADRPRTEPVPPQPHSQAPVQGASEDAPTCPRCNYANNSGSSFCANCGTVLSVARTIVMASPMATPKARLHLVMEGGQPGEVFDLGDETIVGRTAGDVTFPHDGFMSGRHARVERRGASYVLTDEGSRNGTFIKITGEVELKPGDMILIGKQLFRFDV